MILGFQLDRGVAIVTVNHEKHWQGDRLFSINLPVFFGTDCPCISQKASKV